MNKNFRVDLIVLILEMSILKTLLNFFRSFAIRRKLVLALLNIDDNNNDDKVIAIKITGAGSDGKKEKKTYSTQNIKRFAKRKRNKHSGMNP